MSFPAATPAYNTEQNRLIEKLVLKGKLLHGDILLKPADLKELLKIPEDIVQNPQQTDKHIAESGFKIMFVASLNQHVVYVGDQEIEMADNA